jgi:hypothetical protein
MGYPLFLRTRRAHRLARGRTTQWLWQETISHSIRIRPSKSSILVETNLESIPTQQIVDEQAFLFQTPRRAVGSLQGERPGVHERILKSGNWQPAACSPRSWSR